MKDAVLIYVNAKNSNLKRRKTKMKIEKYWHRFLGRFVEDFKKCKYPKIFSGEFKIKGKTYRIKLHVYEEK